MTANTTLPERPLKAGTSSSPAHLLAALFAFWGSALACSPDADTPPQEEATDAAPSHDTTVENGLLALPTWTDEGPPREVHVLAENDHLKVAAVALRRGTPLPIHTVPERITIHVVRGRGELTTGPSSASIGPGSLALLEPNVPHAMTPADQEMVLLLVHYLKQPPSPPVD